MADPRDELLRQIRAIRQRIDPAVLKRASEAALGAQAGGTQTGGTQAGTRTKPPAEPSPLIEPYDKEAARTVVQTFLQSRHDGGQFAMRLMAALKKPPG